MKNRLQQKKRKPVKSKRRYCQTALSSTATNGPAKRNVRGSTAKLSSSTGYASRDELTEAQIVVLRWYQELYEFSIWSHRAYGMLASQRLP